MTTQELIETLNCCASGEIPYCYKCKFNEKTAKCICKAMLSAADRLEQLEEQLAAVIAERDKAVEDLKENSILPYGGCYLCKNLRTDVCDNCSRNDSLVCKDELPPDFWQWRGLGKDGEVNA